MLKKFGIVSFANFLSVLIVFIFQAVATRFLTPNDYGVFSKWLVTVGYLELSLALGLDSSLLNFSKKDISPAFNVARNLIVYLFLAILLFIFIIPFKSSFIYLTGLLVTVISLATRSSLRAYFQYHEKFNIYSILLISKSLPILIGFLIPFFYSKNLSVNQAIIIYSLGTIISLIFVFIIYIKNEQIKRISLRKVWDIEYFKFGIKSILGKVISLLLYALDIYIISFLLDNKSVAYYYVAVGLSKVTWFIADSAGNILYPKFIKSQNENSSDVLNNSSLLIEIVLLFNILSLIGFALLGKILLPIIYESSYILAYKSVLILIIGGQGMVYYKILSRFLASKNRWNEIYLSLIIAIVINIILNFIFIPIWGIEGAAVASLIAYWLCGYVISYKSEFSFWKVFTFRLLRKKIALHMAKA